MKNLLVVILTCLALIQGIFAQTEKQQISEIDKIVLDIKSNINSYKKFTSLTDSLLKNTNTNFIETAYKNDKMLVLVQIRDSGNKIKSADWYFYNKHLIYSEINYHNNDNEKSYYTKNNLISLNKNGDDVLNKTTEYYKQYEKSGINACTIFIERYKEK